MHTHSIAWWPMLTLVAIATMTDLMSRRIPNWLVFPFLGAGIVVAVWMHGWHGLSQSLEGLALGAFLFGVLFALGGMGMGDVKLCAAVGAWIGPQQLMFALVITGLAGGVMALAWAAYRGFLKELFQSSGEVLFGLGKRGLRPHPELVLSNPKARKMPYAPAIAIGTLLSFFAF